MILARLRAWWSSHIVRDATPAEATCNDCRVLHCTAAQAAGCPMLAAATDLPTTGRASERPHTSIRAVDSLAR